MSIHSKWLSQLKVNQLHRLAVLLGTPCSGNKLVRIAAIEDALSLHRFRAIDQNDASKNKRDLPSGHVSLVSIDMGIRNLAFAHLTTKVQRGEKNRMWNYDPVMLSSWQKIDVSKGFERPTTGVKRSKSTEGIDETEGSVVGKLNDRPDVEESTTNSSLGTKGSAAESFDPAIYAERAFGIIHWIVNQYKPTHILIERQRFRSGGSSAVLEWTIRVGVFEGMLYAVLKTLYGIEVMNGPTPVIEGILPMRVNRFWLEGDKDGKCVRGEGATSNENDSTSTSKARTESVSMVGKEVKRAKIEIVSRILEDGSYRTDDSERFPVLPLEFAENIGDLIKYFRSEVDRFGTRRRKKVEEGISVTKLDDLADCLLQGLAWLNWQNNLAKVDGLGEGAYDLGSETGVCDGEKSKGKNSMTVKRRNSKGTADAASKSG